MKCESCSEVEKKYLEIKVGDNIYELEFGQLQLEITGNCNMKCRHCRAANQSKGDMPLDQISKIMKFVRQFSANYKEVTISGGERLLHKKFFDVLDVLKKNGGDYISLTTNGTFLSDDHIKYIKDLNFGRFTFSVSLDSLDESEHDYLRNYKGAYKGAIEALKRIAKFDSKEIIPSMRSTIRPSQIKDMEDMVKFAIQIGCRRISFSAIHPAGRARENRELCMSKEQKKQFIYEVYRLKNMFPELNINTPDPLKFLVRTKNDIGGDNEVVFDGCGAAITTFNVNSDGKMTPCALLDIEMMNVFNMSIEEMTEAYKNNDLVKNMLTMSFNGKCGRCRNKYQCGGCRVRAIAENSDFLGEDPHCWLEF